MSCFINGVKTFVNGIHLLGDLVLCGIARITSCPGHNVEIVPATGSITQIGDAGSQSHGLVANDDLFVSGKFEVNGNAYFDNNIFISDDKGAVFGSTNDVTIRWGTAQTVDTLTFGLDSNSRSVLFIEAADQGFNFAHPAQPNPTPFIHSANQSTTEWLSLAHNQTDAVRGIGSGSHVTNHQLPVDLADDASFDLPDATAGFGTLIVGDGEEYTQWHWTSAGVVTLVNPTANVVATDTDTNFCLFDNGTQVRVRNRLGSAKKVVFDYQYTTP